MCIRDSLGKVMFKSSQPRPCWAVEALPLRRCEFWCPLRYSNWEILGNFIWSCNSCWGQLDTWKIWPFVPKWGGQRGGRWEFASYVLGASFILSQYYPHFFPKKLVGCLPAKQYVWECSTTLGWKTGVLTLCGSRSRCVDGGFEDRGLDTEFHWIWCGWIFTNDIKLSW